jgi:hypothetical protein
MHRTKTLLTLVVALGALALIAVSPALAAKPAVHTEHTFDLSSGATATAPAGDMMAASGDWVRVKGSGRFDPIARTVEADGTFVHYAANGSVHCQGTWKATGFTSFVDFGANSDGKQGGVLSLVVSHFCKTMGMTMTGIPMTVTSTVNAPAGYVAGITLDPFTVPTSANVVIEP